MLQPSDPAESLRIDRPVKSVILSADFQEVFLGILESASLEKRQIRNAERKRKERSYRRVSLTGSQS